MKNADDNKRHPHYAFKYKHSCSNNNKQYKKVLNGFPGVANWCALWLPTETAARCG